MPCGDPVGAARYCGVIEFGCCGERISGALPPALPLDALAGKGPALAVLAELLAVPAMAGVAASAGTVNARTDRTPTVNRLLPGTDRADVRDGFIVFPRFESRRCDWSRWMAFRPQPAHNVKQAVITLMCGRVRMAPCGGS